MSSRDKSPSVIQIEKFAHTQFYIAFMRFAWHQGGSVRCCQQANALIHPDQLYKLQVLPD
jgi:hypothetical protein